MAKPQFSTELNTVFTAHGREYLSRIPADNFYLGNPTLNMMRRVSRKRTGSKYILEPLLEGGEPVGGSYERTEALATVSTDPVTESTYEWAHYAEPVSIFWQDEFHSSGAGALFNYIELRINDARLKLERKLSADLWVAGPSSAISALPSAVDDTLVFGQLDPATQTYWASQVDGTGTVFPTTGLDVMRKMSNDVTQGGLKSHDWIVTDQATWELYVALAEDKHNIWTRGNESAAARLADLGFPVAMYHGKPLTWDLNCPAGEMYWMNNEAIQLCEHYGGPFQLTPFQSMNVNGQQGRIAYLRWSGQVTVRNRRCLGKVTGITAT